MADVMNALRLLAAVNREMSAQREILELVPWCEHLPVAQVKQMLAELRIGATDWIRDGNTRPFIAVVEYWHERAESLAGIANAEPTG